MRSRTESLLTAGACCALEPRRRLRHRSACSARRPFRSARGDAEHRFLGISDLQDLIRSRAADRCATKTETCPERRRGLPRAAAGRHRPRVLPEAESRRRAGQLQRLDRPAAGSHCDRQDRMPVSAWRCAGCKPLEQGLMSRSPPARMAALQCAGAVAGAIQASTSLPTSRARSSRSAISADRTRISSRSSSPGRASIPTRTSIGGPIRAICCSSAVEKGEVQGVPRPPIRSHLWLEGQRLQGGRLQSGRRIQGQDLLHRRIARQPCPRGATGCARAITQALLDAAMFTSQNPDKAAASFQPYAPKTASLQDLQAMVRYHTHHHHPVGARAQARNSRPMRTI